MSSPARRIIGAILVVAVVGSVLSVWGIRQVWGPRVDAYQAVNRPITQTLLVTGRLAPPAQVNLGSQVQSTVVQVFADEGDTVEAGTLLARLADDDALARLGEAEAQVAEAMARLDRVRGVGRSVASERVQQARLRFEETESTFERADSLFAVNAFTEADHDAARKALDTARSQLVAAQLEAAATGREGADTAAAVASLSRAQAGLELAQAGVEWTRLRAPTAGQLLQRHVEPGQVVRPGDALFELASQGRLEVRVTPDELHLGALRVGQEARVVVEAFPERAIQAVVERIAPQIDPSRGTVEVRLAMSDEVDELGLRANMTATVEIVLGAREHALVLPTWLVRDLGTGAPWVLLADDGTAEKRAVVLGLLGDDTVEVTSGLNTTDWVLPVDAAVGPSDPVRTRAAPQSLPER